MRKILKRTYFIVVMVVALGNLHALAQERTDPVISQGTTTDPAAVGVAPKPGPFQPRQPAFVSRQGTDATWEMPGKNTALTRFSELDAINVNSVNDLHVVSTFSLGVNRGQESPALVVRDTLYVVAPFPNTLFALDLTKPGMPLKWRYDPAPAAAAQGVACCDVVNRGPVYSEGRLFFNSLDGFTIAVDANTGKEAWRTKLGNINIGETMTMAPLLAGNKVIVGNSGGEMGVRGWAAALKQSDGQVVWKAYSTGPDADVLIGKQFRPLYEQYMGKDKGVSTWPTDMWKQGGGTVWGWVSYDPDLNLIYYGTSNPGPWNSSIRPGDNLWTAGIFARDADTGQARWFYQFSPHDVSDYDGVNENILVDMDWKGSPRKVLVHPDRNGYVYLLDRETGELLSAHAYHSITSTKGVDIKSGKLIYDASKKPSQEQYVKDVCPAPPGAKDWQPAAFSHKTGHLYIPHNNLCMDIKETAVGYVEGTPYVGAEVLMKPGLEVIAGNFPHGISPPAKSYGQ